VLDRLNFRRERKFRNHQTAADEIEQAIRINSTCSVPQVSRV
jgi:hypothetical protein